MNADFLFFFLSAPSWGGTMTTTWNHVVTLCTTVFTERYKHETDQPFYMSTGACHMLLPAMLLVVVVTGERVFDRAGVGVNGSPTEWLTWAHDAKVGMPRLHKYHHYFDVYERHFARFRGTNARVLELGVNDGGSLVMWRWYFGSKAKVYGSDLNNRTLSYERNPIYGFPDKMLIGDQGGTCKPPCTDVWPRIHQLGELDILIDDGSHLAAHMCRTLDEGLKVLAPGGVLLIEDIDVKYNAEFMSCVQRTLLASRIGLMAHAGSEGQFSKLAPLQQSIYSVAFYPRLFVLEKMVRPRKAIVDVHAGNVGMPQPSIGFNNHGYVCGSREVGKARCNNDGTRRFGGTEG